MVIDVNGPGEYQNGCRICRSDANIGEIEIPYILRFLIIQLASVNINVKLSFKDIWGKQYKHQQQVTFQRYIICNFSCNVTFRKWTWSMIENEICAYGGNRSPLYIRYDSISFLFIRFLILHEKNKTKKKQNAFLSFFFYIQQRH